MCEITTLEENNMNVILITILSYIVKVSSGHILEPIAFNCPSSVPYLHINTETVLIDLEVDDDEFGVDMKDCILKETSQHSNQSLILVKAFEDKDNSQIRITNNANVIIMTKKLRLSLIDTPSFNILYRAHWAWSYIVVTDDNEFKCDNGNMSKADSEMLETIMNNLWHKRKAMFAGVTFPFACKDKIAYYSGKKESKYYSAYDRTITLIDIKTLSQTSGPTVLEMVHELTDQYPLKGNLFFRYPTSITDCDNLHYYSNANLSLTGGYCGMDALVMHDIIKYFKFKIEFIDNDDCNEFGYVKNENKIGSLGCIIRGDLDISFNSRFMTMYSDDNLIFLYYVKTDALCALVREPDVVPVWHCVYDVYSAFQWFLITAIIIMIGIIMWLSEKVTRQIRADEEVRTVYYNIGDATLSTIFGFSLRKQSSLLKCTCLFSSILFVAIYQSHINHAYTTIQKYNTIKTLEELYRSGLTLYTTQTIKEFMKKQKTETKYEKDFKFGAHLMSGNRLKLLMNTPYAVTLGRKSDDSMEIHESYTNDQGKPLIRIVDECFSTYYLSYIVSAEFPFMEFVQTFLDRLIAAGLPDVYYRWTRRMLSLPDQFPAYRNDPRAFTKISLQDMRVTFGILLFGYVGSIVVFIGERWKCKRHIKSRLLKCRKHNTLDT